LETASPAEGQVNTHNSPSHLPSGIQQEEMVITAQYCLDERPVA